MQTPHDQAPTLEDEAREQGWQELLRECHAAMEAPEDTIRVPVSRAETGHSMQQDQQKRKPCSNYCLGGHPESLA